MNRRQFIKGTAGAALCLGSIHLPFSSPPSLQCGRCGAMHAATKGLYLFAMFREPIRYCANCGVDLATLKHNLHCHDYLRCLAQDIGVCLHGQFEYGTCFRVPFPNGKKLLGQNGKTFSLASLTL